MQSIIRSRVPLRLGFAGGGTDLSPYAETHGGAVLNTTIDRYAYAFIAPSDDGLIHFHAPDIGTIESFPCHLDALATARLDLHAAVTARMLRQFGSGPLPLRVTSYVDAPPGSGLGSSSALVVALVEAFASLLSAPLGPYDIAHLAWEIERQDLGLSGGKQDQYAATFGGTNFIEFHAEDRVIVNPLRVPAATLHELETGLVLCFTGLSRRSEAIIEEQQRRMLANSSEAVEGLHRLKADAQDMKQALLRADIPHMAAILNRSWEAKKQTACGISNERIEALRHVAFESGALGGKVSGAGGGGYMMFIVSPERRVGVIRALNQAGGEAAPVHLTASGAESWRASA